MDFKVDWDPTLALLAYILALALQDGVLSHWAPPDAQRWNRRTYGDFKVDYLTRAYKY